MDNQALLLPSDQETPTPQPTRSGRIPLRPTSTSLNPLDFLEFPDESESDDPDFDPLLLQQQPPTFNHTQQQQQQQIEQQLGFDFSILSDLPQPTSTWSPLTNDNQASFNPFNQFQTNETLNELSPLTQGEIAGVPFVNINLPESDDSPEFIPPPTTRSSAAATAAAIASASSSSSRPSKRPRRETNYTATADQNPPANRSLNQPTAGPSKPSKSTKLPASISNRYVAIAPTPDSTSYQDPVRQQTNSNRQIIERSDDDDDDSDHSSQTHRLPTHAEIVQRNTANRSKPGPKPRKNLVSFNHDLPQSSSNLENHQFIEDREDSMKRKREGMRKNRERKKIYIVSLEDRCLELAEENARLREENQELIRESRENWKNKAKSLEVFKLLNQQIQRLQQGTPTAVDLVSPPSNSLSTRSSHHQPQRSRQTLKRKNEDVYINDEEEEGLEEPHRLLRPTPTTTTTSASTTRSANNSTKQTNPFSSSNQNLTLKRASVPSSSSYSHHNSTARGRTLLDVLSLQHRKSS
ncbi:hypothetical protein PGTUg99_013984 [Puccinia graminis f. sp. tritici]|uniref:BZIP domain-containing protein n=1 Tax=Puccinia graminis f. sp. tritici TaxID=56615 RepID=A0A5B0R782_PUCGR|nr:hypothetical protein PGTUg99_013984 [Puccinia graminis f. sp. tritici]